eukprot:6202352-Amphidinium_carterae.1
MSYKMLSKGTSALLTSVEFTANTEKPFTVQLDWPSRRISRRGQCTVLDPRAFLEVTTPDNMVIRATHADKVRRAMEMSNLRVDLPGAAGTYYVSIEIDFPKGEWVDEVVLNTYASETLDIVGSRGPDTNAQRFVELGGFTNAKVNGVYDERHSFEWMVQGRETFWRKDNWYLMYVDAAFIYWCGNDNERMWQVASASQWNDVRAGHCPALAKAPPGIDVLSPEAPKGFRELYDGLWLRKQEAGVVSNSNTDINSGSLLEKGTAETCKQVLARLERLNNAESIIANRADELFPTDFSSIAAPGEKCGDRARAQEEECQKFLEWAALSDIVAADVE